jgi:universal stress protein E
MAKTILVLTSTHEESKCSLKKAHDIAAPLGAEIEVVGFNTEVNGAGDTVASQADALKTAVDDIFQDYEKKDSIKSQVVATDDVARWVMDYCERNEFDLIIKAGHRSESFFHTPCDWKLIRNLRIPVLIASQQRWKCKHVVMAAIDPVAKDDVHIQLNTIILEWAEKWAETFDAELHIVYSIPVANVLKQLDVVDLREHERKHRVKAEQQLRALLDSYDLPNVHMHITAGPPAKTIPHWADELKAELVVMGSMGRQGLNALLVGNVAEKVMHHLRTDSLILENPAWH